MTNIETNKTRLKQAYLKIPSVSVLIVTLLCISAGFATAVHGRGFTRVAGYTREAADEARLVWLTVLAAAWLPVV